MCWDELIMEVGGQEECIGAQDLYGGNTEKQYRPVMRQYSKLRCIVCRLLLVQIAGISTL
jgi:hypothetical protein